MLSLILSTWEACWLWVKSDSDGERVIPGDCCPGASELIRLMKTITEGPHPWLQDWLHYGGPSMGFLLYSSSVLCRASLPLYLTDVWSPVVLWWLVRAASNDCRQPPGTQHGLRQLGGNVIPIVSWGAIPAPAFPGLFILKQVQAGLPWKSLH